MCSINSTVYLYERREESVWESYINHFRSFLFETYRCTHLIKFTYISFSMVLSFNKNYVVINGVINYVENKWRTNLLFLTNYFTGLTKNSAIVLFFTTHINIPS